MNGNSLATMSIQLSQAVPYIYVTPPVQYAYVTTCMECATTLRAVLQNDFV